MSNFFEQELRKLFEDGEVIDDPQFVGRACLGTLGGDLRVRAEFVEMRSTHRYDALRLTILKRTDGVIDVLNLHFRDVLVLNHDLSINTSPYFLVDGNHAGWHLCEITIDDYQAFRQLTGNYLDMFRERAPERAASVPGQKPPERVSKRRDER